MQITIKHKDTEIFIKGSGDCIDKLVAATEKLYSLVAAQDCPPPDIIIPEEATAKLMPFPQSQSKKEESFGIRERIPNNVVDIEKLDVKQAITEKALVRCPKCGQAHALIVKDGQKLILMRKNYDNNEFEIVADSDWGHINDLICVDGNTTVEYFQMLQDSAVIDSSDFAVNNDTELFCPVCHESNSFICWKDAWQNPLHYFETDSLCEICGGELSMSVVKDDMCEGECNVCETEVRDGRPVP